MATSYQPLTDVMASTADGTTVPSAYGDQVRDNLVAIRNGWRFKAVGAVSQSSAASAWSQLQMSTLSNAFDTAVTASTDHTLAIVSGYVTISMPGIWLLSASCVAGAAGTTTIAAMSVGTAVGFASSVSRYLPEGGNACNFNLCDTRVVVTSPTYVGLWVFASSAVVQSTTIAPRIEGTWLGDDV